ncbi:hypothetical protein E1263_21645 [Kribbella antibiotica]|uniref:DUF3137 domain-containing protein n=1 Tax=Kribbella antibiotica TaxID=190195 RepID=A0A4V2YPD9_9ACTN|nr:hypothetical protein [Kribbella antibiotica]TDD57897.1 hypothetical protein E1263_21645 [Kribbella antibiotica]
MSTLSLVLIVVSVVGVGVGAALLIRRQRYIKSLRDRGWTFDGSPGFDTVARLSNPPFGLGFKRSPDDQITGLTAGGRPFQVIEYGSEYWKGWVGMVTLSRHLPELWVTGGQTLPRSGVSATMVPVPPALGTGWTVGVQDPAFANEVLTGQLCVALLTLVSSQPGVNLSIDGDQLVVQDPPRKDPEQLAPWLEQLATLAAAIDAAPLDRWIQPVREPRLSFYQHPEWYWVGQDDSLLQSTPVTRSGHDHSTSNVIRGRDGDGPPFVAFTHDWKTTRTESSTDSEGRTTTRTVTENHSEPLLGFELPVHLPRLTVGYSGRGISFESEAFNDQFSVKADDQKFAYDVIHPRQMEFLMATRPSPFQVTGNWAWFQVSTHDHQTIARNSYFFRDFLAWIPRFVWKNVGLQDSPYPQR